MLPALIRRFYEAAKSQADNVTRWGTGRPLREFLHVDDLGEAFVFALKRWDPDGADAPRSSTADGKELGPLGFLNVGTGIDLSIRELAEAVAAATGFRGCISWDTSKPDGTPKKQLDVSRLAALGWKARISLYDGLNATFTDFSSRPNIVFNFMNILSWEFALEPSRKNTSFYSRRIAQVYGSIFNSLSKGCRTRRAKSCTHFGSWELLRLWK